MRPVKNLSLISATQKYKKSNTTPQRNSAPLSPHAGHPTPLQTETLHTTLLHYISVLHDCRQTPMTYPWKQVGT